MFVKEPSGTNGRILTLREILDRLGRILAATAAVAVSGAIYGVLPAQAGTVSLSSGQAVAFQAAPGEANDLTITDEDAFGLFTVVDAGAPLTAVGPCVSTGPNNATCPSGAPANVVQVNVVLGDLDDRADVTALMGGRILADDGADTVFVTSVADFFVVSGGHGNDTLQNNGTGADLYGEAGADTLRNGPEGQSTMYGGSGADTFRPGEGFAFVSFRFHAATSPVTVDPDGLPDDGAAGEGDNVHPGEGRLYIQGGHGNDKLYSGPTVEYMDGWSGDDLLVGIGHAVRHLQELYGGPGNDQILGGPRPDILEGSSGSDLLKGREGQDHLHGGSGPDRIVGGPGRDEAFGGAHADTFLMRDNTTDDIFGLHGHDRAHVDRALDVVSSVEAFF